MGFSLSKNPFKGIGRGDLNLSKAIKTNTSQDLAKQAGLTNPLSKPVAIPKSPAMSQQEVETKAAGAAIQGAQLDLRGVTPVTGQQVTAVQLSPAERVQAAQLDQTAANQFRDDQRTLMNALLRPQTASAAELQLQRGTQQSLAQQLAMAQSRGAGGGALAQRQAAMNQANISQDANAQAAILRAQEEIGRQQLAGQIATQGRGMDLSAAGQNAAFQQQAGLSNQEALNNFAIQQALLNQQAGMATAGFGQQAGLSNQAIAQQQAVAQAGLNQQSALANQAALMDLYGMQNQGNIAAYQGQLGAAMADYNRNTAMGSGILSGVSQAGVAYLTGGLGAGIKGVSPDAIADALKFNP